MKNIKDGLSKLNQCKNCGGQLITYPRRFCPACVKKELDKKLKDKK